MFFIVIDQDFGTSPSGMNPSDNSNPDSVQQSSTVTNNAFIFELETIMNDNIFALDTPNTNLLSVLPVISSIENERLQIIAEPQQHYGSTDSMDSFENMFQYDGFHEKDEGDGLLGKLTQLSIEQVEHFYLCAFYFI